MSTKPKKSFIIHNEQKQPAYFGGNKFLFLWATKEKDGGILLPLESAKMPLVIHNLFKQEQPTCLEGNKFPTSFGLQKRGMGG